jgi:hypothetical protein
LTVILITLYLPTQRDGKSKKIKNKNKKNYLMVLSVAQIIVLKGTKKSKLSLSMP